WGLGIIVILLLYFFHPSQKFQRSFSMYKLAYLMCCHFTKVYFPSNRKQEKAAISADARSPYDYLQHYKVLESGQLNESTLYYQLSKDLGAPWSKVKVTNIIVYGLFAAFSACIINQRKVADMLLSELTQYFGDSHTHQNGFKQFLRGRRIAKNIEMIVAEVSMKPVIQKLIGQHFYASTLLCELLNHARKSGIMPSASFLWLKKIDRSLWYALNSVGRKTYFSEGAAIVAHWNAERSLGDQIQYPLVCNVITAFKMEYRLHGSRKDEAL
ncbi:secretion/conjugation apparatus DotM-related subunit, partial [Fangia hongkongensis]